VDRKVGGENIEQIQYLCGLWIGSEIMELILKNLSTSFGKNWEL
jgi:hypothetical protein